MTDVQTLVERERARLVRHAYHMLGTMTDAEDVVQDAFVRWHRADTSGVRDPHAFLRATVTHLALDRLRARKRSRETYIGPWLPEPILVDESVAPEHVVTVAEDVSFAFLLALERLSPLERAAFLLHDALDVPFAEIAQTLERSEESVRRLASRARRAIRENAPRRIPEAVDAEALCARFTQAVLAGDITEVTAMLADDVKLLSDGGGKKAAAINPLEGPDHVGRFLVGVARKGGALVTEVRPAAINGLSGFLAIGKDEAGNAGLDSAWAVESRGEKIATVYVLRNPDKLAALAAAAGLRIS
ncbi:MAG TPA: RNA polymerase sigma factor SigJ [Candidatus Baltobacteraceae bacterium]|nr:RNA polymerase sigma factor SigJ [Candidatus Baltobacteraceae bacterium]